MADSYYTRPELEALGFAALGADVHISRKASIYAPEKMRIGSHVRVDDFAFLSGTIGIGDYVHIAVADSLYGKFGIRIGDFVNVSGRVSIYSTSDDYSGAYMTGPLVPEDCIHDIGAPVVLGDHVIIGAGSVLLPGVTLAEGTAVGAMSLVKHSTEPFTIVAGVPARKIKERKRKLLEYARQMKPFAPPQWTSEVAVVLALDGRRAA